MANVMNHSNEKYYKILDILDEIQALDKVIQAHENSPSAFSKNQYVELKNEYLKNLKSILKKENIDFNKLLALGENSSDSYYLPIYNNIEYLLTNLTKQLKSVEDFSTIQNVPNSVYFFMVWTCFESAANILIKKKLSSNISKSTNSSDLVSSLYIIKIISEKDKDFLVEKKSVKDSVVDGLFYEDKVRISDIKKVKDIALRLIQKIGTATASH